MKNFKILYIHKWLVFVLVAVIQIGCKKAVLVDLPSTQLASGAVYENNTTAAAVLTGIYSNMSSAGISGGYTGLSFTAAVLSDEMDNFNLNDVGLSDIYANSLNKENNYFWNELYARIYACNSAIEGLTASMSLKPALKQQLLGEAFFMRAFLNFYAVNLYGDVPLVLNTDYRKNNVISRTPRDVVYIQIVTDLLNAKKYLSDDFMDARNLITTERIRPNRGAATALLARVYLYSNQWAQAEIEATSIIENTSKYTLLNNLNSVFLANSNEAIWQLQPVQPGVNTNDAPVFVLTSAPGSDYFSVAISKKLKNSFEFGDARFTNWIGEFNNGTTNYYYPYKYKVYLQGQQVTEYTMVLRLAEQYLIRAEAKIQQNKVADGIVDLNIIRKRARAAKVKDTDKPLPDYPTNLSKLEALKAVFHERQVELFTEWGHRWFDLQRSGDINQVMTSLNTVKNRIWNPDAIVFPIPQSEILINPNLKQNKGYN